MRSGFVGFVAVILMAACGLDAEGEGNASGASGDAGLSLGGTAGSVTGGAGSTAGASGGGASGSGSQGGAAGTGSAGSAGSGGVAGGSGGASGGSGGASGASGGASGGSGGASGGSGGSGGASGGSGGTGGVPQPVTIDVVAAVADCAAVSNPNPDTCKNAYGNLHIDVSAVSLSNSASRAYLRFNLPPAVTSATVVGAELIMRNVNSSDKSGVIHRVATFVRNDLFSALPAQQSQLAADLGSVGNGDVTWVLPTTGVSSPYCVSVSSDTNDGIGYSNTVNPPRLRITYQ